MAWGLGPSVDVLNGRMWTGFVRDFEIPHDYIGYNLLPERDVASEKFIWDMIFSENGMAPFVAAGQESPRFDREQFTEMRGEIARIRHKLVLDEDDLNTIRMIDEVLGAPQIIMAGNLDLQRRIAEAQVKQDQTRLMQAVYGRIEWMQIHALLGNITYAGENGRSDVNLNVNFPVVQVAPVDTTATGLWSDTVNSNPLIDIQAWTKDLTYSIGKVIYGRQVRFWLTQNAHLKNQLFANGLIRPELLSIEQINNAISGEFGMTGQFYDARTTSKTDDGQTYTITQTKILPDNKIIFLPTEPVGYTATAPSPYNGMKTGTFGWTRDPRTDQSAQDPWTSEAGAGYYGFPIVQRPNRVLVATIA